MCVFPFFCEPAWLRYDRLLACHQASVTMEARSGMAPGQQLPRSNARILSGYMQRPLRKRFGILAAKWFLWWWYHAKAVEKIFPRTQNPEPPGEVNCTYLCKFFFMVVLGISGASPKNLIWWLLKIGYPNNGCHGLFLSMVDNGWFGRFPILRNHHKCF